MIKSLTVTNHLGDSIELELGAPEKTGLLIKSIEGLGPGKANVSMNEMATGDGSLYTFARVPSRNIVISFKFLFTPTIEHVRQLSYKYFPIKQRIKLLFKTDNRLCEIHGYVESNEPDIFSSSEGTNISIICPDPYFYSVSPYVTVFSGIDARFEFPFSNESLTEPLLEMSEIKTETSEIITYTGDGEVGVIIRIHALGPATMLTVHKTDTRETMRINTDRLAQLTGSGIIAGDDLIISTIKGDKGIHLLRGGVYTNILNCLDKDTDWLSLTKGQNTFAYVAETGINNLEFSLQNSIIYEGV